MKHWIALAAAAIIAAGGAARADEKKVEQITCAEFLALSPDHQERLAYWVDGYAQSKSPESVSAVGFDKFGRPIDSLTACEATPDAAFVQTVEQYCSSPACRSTSATSAPGRGRPRSSAPASMPS
jgi:hypothetical protein